MANHDLAQSVEKKFCNFQGALITLCYNRPALKVMHYCYIAVLLLSIPIEIEHRASSSQHCGHPGD